jgi:hypothetical protein
MSFKQLKLSKRGLGGPLLEINRVKEGLLYAANADLAFKNI